MNCSLMDLDVFIVLVACVTRVYRYVTLAVLVMYMADLDVIFVATLF